MAVIPRINQPSASQTKLYFAPEHLGTSGEYRGLPSPVSYP